MMNLNWKILLITLWKTRYAHFTERKTEGQMLSALHKPTQDLNKYLRNPTSLKVFSGNQRLLFLPLVKLLMLSWMGHGVALTLLFLNGARLRSVTVAFISTWHTELKLFHLNPRGMWSYPFSMLCAGCWLSQGSIWAVSLSQGVVLCNSARTRGWCSCSRAPDKYLEENCHVMIALGISACWGKVLLHQPFTLAQECTFEENPPNRTLLTPSQQARQPWSTQTEFFSVELKQVMWSGSCSS